MSSLIRSRQVFNVAMVISVERAATLRRRTRTKVPESRPATPRTEASPVRPRPTTDKEQPFYRRERDSGATALRTVSFNQPLVPAVRAAGLRPAARPAAHRQGVIATRSRRLELSPVKKGGAKNAETTCSTR